MRDQIERTLHCLIGQRFWGAGRVLNLLTFQFGPRQVRSNHRGETSVVGTYALHVQCAWHLTDTRTQKIVVASGDRHEEPDDENREKQTEEEDVYAWPKAEQSLLDERLLRFFLQADQAPVFVQALQADEYGGLLIGLSSSHALTLFPNTSASECWRFFQPGTDRPHFVITGQGIEDVEE